MEAMRLCAEIAKAENLDPTEVMAKASEYKGQSKLNPASMTDDRLLHTLLKLRERHGRARDPTLAGRDFVGGLETFDSIRRRREAAAQEGKPPGERGTN